MDVLGKYSGLGFGAWHETDKAHTIPCVVPFADAAIWHSLEVEGAFQARPFTR